MSRNITRDEGNALIDFELTKGADVDAIVLTPETRPAARAKVAVALSGTHVDIRNGGIQARSTSASLLETDGAGRFRIPPQDPGYELIITHPTGYARFKPIPRSNRRLITLDPWTRVEGTYRVNGKPRANIPITIYNDDPIANRRDEPRCFTSFHATTGPNGQFVFERVAAGHGSIGRVLSNGGRATSDMTPSSTVAATFPLGRTVHIDVNEPGRMVVGKLRLSADFNQPVKWNFARVEIEPDDNEGCPADAQLTAPVGPDGSFHIDNVPSGEYVLDVRFTAGHLWEHQFVVPPTEGNAPLKPVELGDLELQKN